MIDYGIQQKNKTLNKEVELCPRIHPFYTQRTFAPLPEFYQRRIIFWQDEDREFESMLDELSIPLCNNHQAHRDEHFAVKKLLLHDDLSGNYWFIIPSLCWSKDNWLLDYWEVQWRISLRPYLYAQWMSWILRQVRRAQDGKLYAKFFDSKERIEGWKELARIPIHRCSFILTLWLAGRTKRRLCAGCIYCCPFCRTGWGKQCRSQQSNKFGNIDASGGLPQVHGLYPWGRKNA